MLLVLNITRLNFHIRLKLIEKTVTCHLSLTKQMTLHLWLRKKIAPRTLCTKVIITLQLDR